MATDTENQNESSCLNGKLMSERLVLLGALAVRKMKTFAFLRPDTLPQLPGGVKSRKMYGYLQLLPLVAYLHTGVYRVLAAA